MGPARAWSWALVAWAAAGRLAAAAEVVVTVDPTEVEIGESLTMAVSVHGSLSGGLQLPALPDFRVQSSGRSTRMSYVNGTMSREVVHSYLVTPTRAGTFVIGAVTATVGGQVLRSAPLSVTVRDPAAAMPPTPPPDPDAPPGGADRAAEPLFIEAQISNPTPFAGEQVVYTWRFYHRVRVANASVTLPTFSGFTSEPLGKQQEREETIAGRTYSVTQVQTLLVPDQAGEATVSGSQLQCDVLVARGRHDDSNPFDNLFGRGHAERRTLRSPPMSVAVQPLPEPAPADFTGLVGNFTLDVQLSRRELAVGDSTTLTATVRGQGNLQPLVAPGWRLPASVRAYDDRPQASTDGMVATKTFRRALVPTAAGEISLGVVAVTFFQPALGRYQTLTSPPLALRVAAAAGQTSPPVPTPAGSPPLQRQVEVLGEDIQPNRGRPGILALRALDLEEPRRAAALAVPPAVFLASWAWQARRRHASGGRGRARQLRRAALARAQKLLPQMQAEIARGGAEAAANMASRALRQFVGDKLGREGLSLTAAEVVAMLAVAGVDANLAAETRQFLARCETAQYGVAPGTISLYGDLVPRLATLLRRLDGILGRGGRR